MARKYQYTVVEELPKGALKVKEYAKRRGVSHTLIYKELIRGTASFKMIQFQGINFVIVN